eukprot:TRINITY_DN5111_c0_g1_i1.p1 TRINITY_DN5111_c0_g1~~TRINITY_DN5111_c0_g1_i1.p1  ORF type:complete len:868 (+),score=305.86 TRINITY_DN5111_c0_g1_i1:81-2606(+)
MAAYIRPSPVTWSREMSSMTAVLCCVLVSTALLCLVWYLVKQVMEPPVVEARADRDTAARSLVRKEHEEGRARAARRLVGAPKHGGQKAQPQLPQPDPPDPPQLRKPAPKPKPADKKPKQKRAAEVPGRLGDRVVQVSGGQETTADCDGQALGWALRQGDVATVVEMDDDGDCRLRNPAGVVSCMTRAKRWRVVPDRRAPVADLCGAWRPLGTTRVYWISAAGAGTASGTYDCCGVDGHVAVIAPATERLAAPAPNPGVGPWRVELEGGAVTLAAPAGKAGKLVVQPAEGKATEWLRYEHSPLLVPLPLRRRGSCEAATAAAGAVLSLAAVSRRRAARVAASAARAAAAAVQAPAAAAAPAAPAPAWAADAAADAPAAAPATAPAAAPSRRAAKKSAPAPAPAATPRAGPPTRRAAAAAALAVLAAAARKPPAAAARKERRKPRAAAAPAAVSAALSQVAATAAQLAHERRRQAAAASAAVAALVDVAVTASAAAGRQERRRQAGAAAAAAAVAVSAAAETVARAARAAPPRPPAEPPQRPAAEPWRRRGHMSRGSCSSVSSGGSASSEGASGGQTARAPAPPAASPGTDASPTSAGSGFSAVDGSTDGNETITILNTVTGHSLSIEGVWSTVPVAKLKRKLEWHCRVPVSQQKLVCDSTEMELDSEMCSAYGVRNGVVVLLQVLPPDGGMLPLCPLDAGCPNFSNPDHQRRFVHTCRLRPCPNVGVDRWHDALFRHDRRHVQPPPQHRPFPMTQPALGTVIPTPPQGYPPAVAWPCGVPAAPPVPPHTYEAPPPSAHTPYAPAPAPVDSRGGAISPGLTWAAVPGDGDAEYDESWMPYYD